MFFGTIKEVSIGPTSLMALLTLQYTADKPPEFAIILAFLSGCVELAMGILKLGESCHGCQSFVYGNLPLIHAEKPFATC